MIRQCTFKEICAGEHLGSKEKKRHIGGKRSEEID